MIACLLPGTPGLEEICLFDACLDKVSYVLSDLDRSGAAVSSFQFTSSESAWGIRNSVPVRISGNQLGPTSLRTKDSRFNALYFENEVSGWIVGDEGIIMRTADGGLTWVKLESGTDVDLWTISGSSGGIVWASGWKHTRPARAEREYRTIISHDFGRSWTVIVSDLLQNLDHIAFLDAKIGYALRSDGKLIRTNDGGENWLLVDAPEGILGFHFLDGELGWTLDQKTLYQTIDGGNRWRELFKLPSDLFPEHGQILFLNPKDGWIASGRYFLRTKDGGKTWETVNFPSGLE